MDPSKIRKIKKIQAMKEKNKRLKTGLESMETEESNTDSRRLGDLDEEEVMQEQQKEDNSNQFEDEFDDEYEKEIVDEHRADGDENSDDFESVEEEVNNVTKKVYKQKTKEESNFVSVPFIGTDKNLGQDEYLDYDNSAYNMLHRANTEWPCLSIDWLSGEVGSKTGYNLQPSNVEKDVQYPLDLYAVSGSQASLPSKNRIYVMRFANLMKTKNDDDPEFEEEGTEKADDFNEGNPIILHRSIPIKGGINRIRSMGGYPIVALQSESRQVKIYNLEEPLEELRNADIKKKAERKAKTIDLSPISHFKHNYEGYGLEWSPHKLGLLASGSNNGGLQFYMPKDASCSMFEKLGNEYTYHQDSIEDIQFCPKDPNGVATCSMDGTVQFLDLRVSDRHKSSIQIDAHECDVNVISWNKKNPILIASGADDGSFKVFDLRYPKEEPITFIQWHEDQITSIEWQPDDQWTLAVSSADNRLSIWDFSVEDDSHTLTGDKIPEQIIFLHQGQDDIKELKWSPHVHNTLITTAANGYNIFQPGTDQEQEYLEEINENKLDIIPDQIENNEMMAE